MAKLAIIATPHHDRLHVQKETASADVRSSLQPLLPACLAQPEGRGLVRNFSDSAWMGKILQMGLAREHEPERDSATSNVIGKSEFLRYTSDNDFYDWGYIGLSDVKEPSEDEIMSLLHASRQLGSDYDQDIARQLANRIRSWSPGPAKPQNHSTDSQHKVQIIATAMALSIPIMAIAGWAAHADGFYAVLALDAIIILSALWR